MKSTYNEPTSTTRFVPCESTIGIRATRKHNINPGISRVFCLRNLQPALLPWTIRGHSTNFSTAYLRSYHTSPYIRDAIEKYSADRVTLGSSTTRNDKTIKVPMIYSTVQVQRVFNDSRSLGRAGIKRYRGRMKKEIRNSRVPCQRSLHVLDPRRTCRITVEDFHGTSW